jgi:cell division protein FtsN
MYTNSRSPTFVEILIAVVVLFAVIGIFVRGCNNEEGAKKEAEKWSSQKRGISRRAQI